MKNYEKFEPLFVKACDEQDENTPAYQAMMEVWEKLDNIIQQLPEPFSGQIDLLVGSLEYRAQRCGFFLGMEVMRND